VVVPLAATVAPATVLLSVAVTVGADVVPAAVTVVAPVVTAAEATNAEMPGCCQMTSLRKYVEPK
jgi:hypothetical protein